MTVTEAFERFLRKKRLKNLAEKTIKNYVEFVTPFNHYVGETLDVMEITTDSVLDYISTLYDRPLADASRSTHMTHIKAFLRWLKDCYNIPVAISEIEMPKVGKKQVHMLSENDIKTLFSSITCESEWMRLRNCAIIALMLGSGLRRGEVVCLKWNNMYFDNGYAIVCGKGNKERCVPLGAFVIDFLLKYKEQCPYENEFVFVERYGNPITVNAIKQLVQKIKCRTGIDFSAHKLRHNFATNWCKDSLEETGQCDAFTLQVLMGHEDVKTTEKYMHYAQSMVASQNAHCHLDKVFGV